MDWTRVDPFTDSKFNVADLVISVHDRIENIVGKGENAGYQNFIISPLCSEKATSKGLSSKVLNHIKVDQDLMSNFENIVEREEIKQTKILPFFFSAMFSDL